MLNNIRGLVRPFVIATGWVALIVMVTALTLKFADMDMTKIMLVAFLELMSGIIGYWFGQRKAS